MTRIISIVGGLQPSTPTIGTATAGDTTASVAFTPSTYIGKGTITYTATSSPGGLTATSATSPITVTGLTNGTAYTFTVTGTTNYGVTSIASSASNSITPALGDTGYMFPIATTTVSSATAASVTFASIPQTYKHLQIRCFSGSPTSATSSMTINFNSDTSSANYRNHYVAGNGSSVFTGTNGNQEYIGIQGANATTGMAINIYDILDYTNTNKLKVVRSLGGYDTNGSGYGQHIWVSSVLWKNTNAINQIVLNSSTTNFIQYSSFALYGIKGA